MSDELTAEEQQRVGAVVLQFCLEAERRGLCVIQGEVNGETRLREVKPGTAIPEGWKQIAITPKGRQKVARSVGAAGEG